MRIALAALVVATIPWAGQAQGPGQGFPGGQGRPGGPGGLGPGMQTERKVVAQFDRDGNGRLDAAERRAAREWLESQPAAGPGGRGRGGGRGMMPAAAASVSKGEPVTPASVRTYGRENLYDPAVLRTFFLDFENDDWERELEIFSNTDVEVPATLTVDGQVYRDVGVHFRGASSLFTVGTGQKRSLNLTVDWVHGRQAVGGYRTLNLLNSHVDPTYLRTMLYMQAAREYVPAPKVNYVRVAINSEHWGIYINTQQFNRELISEWFGTTDGARWKVPGSPNGRGGLEYLGDDPEAYKRAYEIKSKDDPKAWAALVALCRTLNTTRPDQLEQALAPMLNLDGALKFLALEMALANADGYWTRASDYSIYLDTKGVFHLLPHDANETFGPAGGRGIGGRGGGPGGPGAPGPGQMPPPGAMPPLGMPPGGGGQRMGGPGMAGPELDPLSGLNDATKPLRSRLLAVPALRERYLQYVKQIATKWLDWKTLGPLAQQYHALIAEDVRKDTHKLDTFEAFEAGVGVLKTFVDRRRAYLLAYQAP